MTIFTHPPPEAQAHVTIPQHVVMLPRLLGLRGVTAANQSNDIETSLKRLFGREIRSGSDGLFAEPIEIQVH